MVDPERLRAAYRSARDALLAERTPDGHWVGELSSSALSTATGVTALAIVARSAGTNPAHERLIDGGLRWLADHQNPDGGWGDTVKSVSNISTTMLCRAAFHVTGRAEQFAQTVQRCETWLFERYGRTSEELAEAVRKCYGKDRTFSVPILMMCALAGLVPWKEVPRLPFEMACLPKSWYRFARMPVVSYALPALIAIGQVVHFHRSTWNPITWILRKLGRRRSLHVLERIQPSSGGYLEATPLTSFVVMSLGAMGPRYAASGVIAKGVEFIVKSARPDGSWPIDTNLSIWVTTLSVNALAAAGDLNSLDRRDELLAWLLKQQLKEIHPYTGAAPGAWGWSYEPGSVPDCDDTPGALLAIRAMLRPGTPKQPFSEFFRERLADVADVGKPIHISAPPDDPAVAAIRGINWMLDLQNSDGGWPTFCRGWGKLPFDRSGNDLTAHVLRAIESWKQSLIGCTVVETLAEACNLSRTGELRRLPLPTFRKIDRAVERGLSYLSKHQRPDGSWLPLWFGNQHAPDDINPVYGTAKVLAAYRDLKRTDIDEAQRGIAFLLDVQNADGGWGGAKDTPSSVEETALAVEVLVDLALADRRADVERGIEYLLRFVEDGTFRETSPIGFYFAKLWYFEKLYPIIFTVAALGREVRKLTPENR